MIPRDFPYRICILLFPFLIGCRLAAFSFTQLLFVPSRVSSCAGRQRQRRPRVLATVDHDVQLTLSSVG